MSTSGISTSSLFNYETQSLLNQTNQQQFQQEFQQLGQALESGNTSAAQTDLSALQDVASPATTGSSASSNPVTQSFSQLSQALQSGNLTAAQKDYSNIQQDFQTRGTQGAHGHHHRHGGGGSEEDQNQVSQTFAQLGQELQTGDLSGSQQAYSSLQQEMQSLTPNGAAPSAEGTAIGSVSVTV